MISENLKVLIDKLKKKTESGKAIWSKTSVETEFKLELQKGAITTDKWDDSQNGESLVDLLIINANGDVIERAVFGESEPIEYKQLLEVYELAKKSYYKVDETIKTIFDELDSENTVGKGTNDLPF